MLHLIKTVFLTLFALLFVAIAIELILTKSFSIYLIVDLVIISLACCGFTTIGYLILFEKN